jgi:hypothetical protein
LLAASLFVLVACRTQIQAPADGNHGNSASVTAATVGEIAPLEPLDPEQTVGPARLQIPDIGLDVEVTEMGWQVVMVNDTRTTRWMLPEDSVGWHVNSAGPGAVGNTILSGRQVGPDAPLAALAVGEIEVGQEVLLTDADGIVFVYRIVEVTDPIPAAGGSEEDQAQAAAYFEPTDTPRLTLATGWPDFTTTHRIFALGEFEGVAR